MSDPPDKIFNCDPPRSSQTSVWNYKAATPEWQVTKGASDVFRNKLEEIKLNH